MNEFAQKLQDFFTGRIEELLMESRESNLRYRTLAQEYDKSMDALLEELEKETQKQVLQLEEIQDQIASIDLDVLYFHGILDGIALLKAIQLIA